jgi:hypothetical protein
MNIVEELISCIVNDPDKRERGISGTSLTYNCDRQAYYDIVCPETEVHNDLKVLGKFFRGIAIDHELKRRLKLRGWVVDLPESEFKVEWEGIPFHPDAYKDGVLLELKVTTYIPKTMVDIDHYYSHYIRQIQFYAYVLSLNGYPVKEMWLVFFDVSEGTEPKLFQIPPAPIEEIEAWMRSKKDILVNAIKNGVAPPRSPGLPWPCLYCSFAIRCFMEG